MGFTKKTWKNRIAEYINRRLLTMEDGSTNLVTVARDEGTISQEGDAFNAANMNDLEDRIEEGFDEIKQSLTNENSETFNFGVKDGVRGFFTNPLRADDSFIPFSNGLKNLKPLIPSMTSDVKPSGAVTYSSQSSSVPVYQAFNGNFALGGRTANGSIGQFIQYTFQNPVNIAGFIVALVGVGTYKFSVSYDGTKFIDVIDFITNSSNSIYSSLQGEMEKLKNVKAVKLSTVTQISTFQANIFQCYGQHS